MRLLVLGFLFLSTIAFSVAEEFAGIDYVEQAKREFNQGHLDAALSALDLAEKRAPATAIMLDLRGCVFMEQGKFDDALKMFETAQATDPKAYLPRLHRGDALLRQGKWAEAREAYEVLMKSTDILTVNERLRFGVLLTYLGGKDDAGAKGALERVMFPTETAAYYYAQAAWAFAHVSKRAGAKWLRTADEIFDAQKSAWFARPLHDFGWIKSKPPLAIE